MFPTSASIAQCQKKQFTVPDHPDFSWRRKVDVDVFDGVPDKNPAGRLQTIDFLANSVTSAVKALFFFRVELL